MKTLYWNETIETASRDRMRELQNQRLRRVVTYAWTHSAGYRSYLDDHGVKPEDIGGVEDLHRLPLMGKQTLREHYPLGFLCVDRTRVREMHMSSGFTGRPVVMPYTEADIDQWAECMARCYRMAGVDAGRTVQITPGFGLFNGGFGFYHGARKAGLFVIPSGPGNTQRQLRLARDLETDVLCGVVSYGIRLLEIMRAEDIRLPRLKVGLFGAESFSAHMRRRIEDGLELAAYDIYGMTETGGVGTTGMDCPAKDGIHVWEDQYIVEVVDPTTGEVLPDGREGELVFTALQREAFPVIRFRSGDLSSIRGRDTCACGRTHVRVDYIKGRCDDMLIIKGVNLFPREIEDVLMMIPGVGEHYQIAVTEREGLQDVQLKVEAGPGIEAGAVEAQLHRTIGLRLRTRLYRLGELERKPGKAERVVYTRQEV